MITNNDSLYNVKKLERIAIRISQSSEWLEFLPYVEEEIASLRDQLEDNYANKELSAFLVGHIKALRFIVDLIRSHRAVLDDVKDTNDNIED